MNWFQQPSVGVIYTANILYYMMVDFRISRNHEIRTFSIIFAKPGSMADTLFILALPWFQPFDSSKCLRFHCLQIADHTHGLPKTWSGLLPPDCS